MIAQPELISGRPMSTRCIAPSSPATTAAVQLMPGSGRRKHYVSRSVQTFARWESLGRPVGRPSSGSGIGARVADHLASMLPKGQTVSAMIQDRKEADDKGRGG